MIKVIVFAIALIALCPQTYSQCLTDFEKKVPDLGLDYSEGFGFRTSIWQDIMAVGAPTSDSLGRVTGIVYLFQNVNQRWLNIGILKPSQQVEGLTFGYSVKVVEDYIFVGARFGRGRVYVFKKPVSGWGTSTEFSIIEEPNTQQFGVSTWLSNIEVSNDQQTLIISDEGYQNNRGAVFVYHKQPFEDWTKSLFVQIIINPDNDSLDLGRGGMAINGNYLAIGTPFGASGEGIIYMFQTINGRFNDLQLVARLEVNLPSNFFLYFGSFSRLVFTDVGIFSSAVTRDGPRIVFFQKPSTGWVNSFQTCTINPTSQLSGKIYQTSISLSFADGRIYSTFQTDDKKGYIIAYTPNGLDWCSANREIIYETTLTSPSSFGVSNTAGPNVVLTGLVGHPDEPNSEIALLSLHKSSTNWIPETIANFKKSNAGYFKGISMHHMDNTLFVGATRDSDIRAGAGAVYIYREENGTWKKIGKILPTDSKKNEGAFGYNIAGHGDYLAVGAQGFGNGGKIFIYKKNGSDWSTPMLTKVLEAPPNVNSRLFGQSVAISDKWLIASFQRSGTTQDGDKNYIHIYKREGEDWVLFETLVPGGISFFARSNVFPVSMYGDYFVFGDTFNTATVYQFNSISNSWQKIAMLNPSDPEYFQVTPDFESVVTNGSYFGISVLMQQDKIFVGAPIRDFESTRDVGAVYVYTKGERESWTSRTETAKILPKDKVSRDLFGFSLSSLENILIVGAIGSDNNYDNSTRNLPGKAHVIQALDYNWKNTIELLTLTGDTFKKDYFGGSHALDYNYFFIGSPFEDTLKGALSGSVYITKSPPLVKLQNPICVDSEPINLFGYPFGGVWNGKGISDESKGTFDPKKAGVGIHEITYKTPNCFYTGKLLIEVKAAPKALLQVGTEQILCLSGKTFTTLSAEFESNVTCRWFFRKDESSAFQQYSIPSFSIEVNVPGEYKAVFSNDACTIERTIFVKNENLQIILNIPPVCDQDLNFIELSAQPNGGTWSGTAVDGNLWNVKNLMDGQYSLTYRYSSSNSCLYSITQQVEIRKFPNVSISRLNGDICSNGEVTLAVQPSSLLSYKWFKKGVDGEVPLTNSITNTIRVVENGTYVVEIDNGLCKKFLKPFILNDQFTVELEPKDNRVKTCSLEPFFIKTPPMASDRYLWFYGIDPNILSLIEDHSDSFLEITKTGNYLLKIERGSCVFKSDTIFIEYSEPQRISAPNVFTPNDDGYNDTFSIQSTYEQTEIKIFNRYGKTVFTGKSSDEWRGDGISTGVYFWFASFVNCLGENETVKGIVQLLR